MEECSDCGYSCDSREKLERHLKIHAVGLKCVRCDFSASTRAKWQEHINSPRHVQSHRCHETTSCTFVGDTEKVLKDHIRAVHNRKKAFKCSKCVFVAETSSLLKRHSLEHKKDAIMATSTQRFKCTICGYSAESERKYKNHVWKHGGKKNYKCDKCDFEAPSEPKLNNHRRKHQDDGITFNCPTCGKVFKNPDALKGHKRLHTKKAHFVCPLIDKNCSFTTTLAEYLRAHCRNQHPNETVFKCTKCNFFTRDTDVLEKHVESLHAAAEFYSCQHCDYATDKEKLFENHVRTKHAPAKKSRCVICKEVFASREELEEHTLSHRETTKKKFDCSKCSFKTFKYGEYRAHIVEHLQDESEGVDGNIELPDDWMEKPTIVSTTKSPQYPGYGPISNATSSETDTRQNSPGIFDFKKNVAGFVAKKRKVAKASPATVKTEITMEPMVLKQETGPSADESYATNSDLNGCPENVDVKPDVRAMEKRREREGRDAADVKPEIPLPSPFTDIKPVIP